MRLDDTVKLSTRMFKTNPGRTWLTILGMGVGTAAVVMLVGLGFGLQGILLNQIILGDTLLSLNVTTPNAKVLPLSDTQVADMKQITGVDDVAPLATFPALLTMNDLTGNVTLQGADPQYFRYTGAKAEKGDLFMKEEAGPDRGKILISKAALKLFQVQDPAAVIGKTVKLRVFVKKSDGTTEEVNLDKEYVVKGVTSDVASITATLTRPEFLSQFAVTSYDRVQVKALNTTILNSVQAELIKRGYTVTALSKVVQQANQIFSAVQMILAGFGGIALLVSAIGMFNTMTVTLLERTNEIGVMRTIGASPIDIKILFLAEAMIVGFLGGLVGILMGCGVGLTINLLLNMVASRYGGISVNLFGFPILFLLFIEGFSGLVGLLTGIFPAKRASVISPLEAIRYK